MVLIPFLESTGPNERRRWHREEGEEGVKHQECNKKETTSPDDKIPLHPTQGRKRKIREGVKRCVGICKSELSSTTRLDEYEGKGGFEKKKKSQGDGRFS